MLERLLSISDATSHLKPRYSSFAPCLHYLFDVETTNLVAYNFLLLCFMLEVV